MEIRNEAERDALAKATNSLLKAFREIKGISETVDEQENLRKVIKKLLDIGLEIEDAIYMYNGKEEEEDAARRALDQGSRE